MKKTTKKKTKTPAQLDREIADVLSPPTELKLKDRHSGNHVWLTLRDGRVVGVMGSDPARYMRMTTTEARHRARYGGSGRASSHSTKRRGRTSHATKSDPTMFAVEIDRSTFDGDLPAGAKWREDLAPLAEKELGRGRTYRRPAKPRYDVIEWTGYRGEVGKLLDWMEGADGITRYAEIFE